MQVAESEDQLDDISTPWPESRRQVTLGTLTLERVVVDQDRQGLLAFDPGKLVPGIESVGDPMLQVRSAAYLMAYEQRRRAKS